MGNALPTTSTTSTKQPSPTHRTIESFWKMSPACDWTAKFCGFSGDPGQTQSHSHTACLHWQNEQLMVHDERVAVVVSVVLLYVDATRPQKDHHAAKIMRIRWNIELYWSWRIYDYISNNIDGAHDTRCYVVLFSYCCCWFHPLGRPSRPFCSSVLFMAGGNFSFLFAIHIVCRR